MPRSVNAGVTGDLTGTAASDRISGLIGGRAYAVAGFRGSRVSGTPNLGLRASLAVTEAADALVSTVSTSQTVTPAWLAGQPDNQFFRIAGTANPPGGLNMNAFCDFTLMRSNSKLIAAASGGHSDGASNAVAMVDLEANSPGWTLLKASTWNGSEANVLYYADGTPASRHTYHHTWAIESLNAVLLAGCRFAHGNGTPQGLGMDLFSLTTNQWLPRYTWPDIPSGGGFGHAMDSAGNIWTNGARKFTVSTGAWTSVSGALGRYPTANDTVRNRIFGLLFNDGEGFDFQGLGAAELNPTNGTARGITFNSSAALTQFIADAPQYAGMGYSPVTGKFYFLHPGRINTFYVVTPNATATWDMATWSPGGVTLASSGVFCKRIEWAPRLGGFVIQDNAGANLAFIKVM